MTVDTCNACVNKNVDGGYDSGGSDCYNKNTGKLITKIIAPCFMIE